MREHQLNGCGPGAARLVDKFGYPIDKADTLRRSARILPLLDTHLGRHAWLAAAHPTLADCAGFSNIALAPEDGVDLGAYPHPQAWIQRVKTLPDDLPMPGL